MMMVGDGHCAGAVADCKARQRFAFGSHLTIWVSREARCEGNNSNSSHAGLHKHGSSYKRLLDAALS
jgi:hypothetical protein